MSTTQAEPRNETPHKDDLREQIQELKKNLEVQAATNAGAQATQAATHAGTWSTMLAGTGGLIVGLFLALAFSATRRK
jgi:predicted lipid-binding transport protein (Tim44 family)